LLKNSAYLFLFAQLSICFDNSLEQSFDSRHQFVLIEIVLTQPKKVWHFFPTLLSNFSFTAHVADFVLLVLFSPFPTFLALTFVLKFTVFVRLVI
jgi:hypothetical protein